jgi:regulator of sigma E protease
MFDFLQAIPIIGSFLSVALPFLIVLGVVVSIHEYGHYIVGRWCGIHAEVFSLGIGPVLTSWRDKHGTKWQVSAIPVGGFVKFLGDRDPSSVADSEALKGMNELDRSRSFPGAALPRRALTVFAGPAANFLLSIVVFAGMVLYTGIANVDPVVGEVVDVGSDADGLREGDYILAINGVEVSSYPEILEYALENEPENTTVYRVKRDADTIDVFGPFPFPALVSSVQPVSPASRAGLKSGDVILAVGEKEIHSFIQLRDTIVSSEQTEVQLSVWRDGAPISLSITPLERDTNAAEGGFEKKVSIGVVGGLAFNPVAYTPTPWAAVWIGVQRTWLVITGSIEGIYHMIAGNISATNLQGPLGIAQVSGDTASEGLLDMINLIGVISTAIGLLNLFPIPVLDGGHLVIFGYEALRGKPPSDRAIQIAMSLGLTFLLMVMVFATYNDIMRL